MQRKAECKALLTCAALAAMLKKFAGAPSRGGLLAGTLYPYADMMLTILRACSQTLFKECGLMTQLRLRCSAKNIQLRNAHNTE